MVIKYNENVTGYSLPIIIAISISHKDNIIKKLKMARGGGGVWGDGNVNYLRYFLPSNRDRYEFYGTVDRRNGFHFIYVTFQTFGMMDHCKRTLFRISRIYTSLTEKLLGSKE